MQIEKISFQAFGPYVDKVELAMDELAKHHLFLIKGPTGAGKTVILDAITFALYGKSSSGERGDFEAMRSRMASEKQNTFVELIFKIHGHRYRFYREIAAGKKRSGEIRYKQSVNGGELIENQFYPFFENCKMTLLEKQAEKLIGLNHAQFIRTMILPQGKFERLLISNSEEKQEILKSLFQSERWEKLCEALSENLKKRREQTEQLSLAIENCFAQAEVKTTAECQALIQDFKQQLILLRQKGVSAKKLMEEKQKHYEEQQRLVLLMQKRSAYKAKENELFKQEAAIQLKAQQVEKADEYERLNPYIKAYQEKKKHRAQVMLQLKENEEILRELESRCQMLEKQNILASEREQELEQLKQECQVWQQQLSLCEEKKDKEKEMRMLHQQQQQTKKLLDEKHQSLEQLKLQRADAQKRIAKLDETAGKYSELLVAAERMDAKKLLEKEIAQLVKQQQQWQENSRKAKQKTAQLEIQEQALSKQHEEYYQSYLHDSASLLASLLKEGSACPICGSLHHPNPMKAGEQLIELETLKECKKRWDCVLKQIQELKSWLKQTELYLQESTKQITEKKQLLKEKSELLDIVDEQQLKQRLSASKQALQELNKQKDIVSAIEQKLPVYEADYEAILKKFQSQQQCYLSLEAKCKERYRSICDTDSSALLKHMEMAKQKITGYEAFIVSIKQDYKQVQLQLSARCSGIEHLKETVESAECDYIRVRQELDEKNYLKLDIEKPLLDELKIKQYKTDIQEYYKQLTELKAAIQELNDQIEDQVLEPLEKLKQEYEETSRLYHQYVNDISRKEVRLEQLIQLEQRISRLQQEYEESLLTYTRQSEFVKAMRGDTSIGIERYVLGIMLSHITQSANALLKNVHDGRYQLYRSDDTSGKVRKYGLELSIYDNASASMRSAASLSGGEKFLVSLALSLALSTVVQARNSGVAMDSMFIDEGFGSLDEASIADALQVLNSMANTKTMIGIISHVELLKENIPYGIEVTKGKQESTCRMLL